MKLNKLNSLLDIREISSPSSSAWIIFRILGLIFPLFLSSSLIYFLIYIKASVLIGPVFLSCIAMLFYYYGENLWKWDSHLCCNGNEKLLLKVNFILENNVIKKRSCRHGGWNIQQGKVLVYIDQHISGLWYIERLYYNCEQISINYKQSRKLIKTIKNNLNNQKD